MRRARIILQIVIAFLIATFGYNLLYEPHQEVVRAAVQKGLNSQTEVAAETGTGAIPQGKLRITVLDVGQGDALLLQDGKRNIMVDVGDSRQDKMQQGGRAVLEKKLAQAGVQRIKTAIVTHHHADHMGNIKWMAGKYGISNIYDNGYENPRNPTSQWLYKELRAGHYHGKALKAGDVVKIEEGYYFEVLAPGDFIPLEEYRNLNNTSLVLKLHYGKFTMLLTGDAEAPVEDALQRRYGSRLRADVLKVGHHGSKTSSFYKFLEQVKPRYALISCGDYSIYHHPNEEVVKRLQHLGAKVVTTHGHGDIVIESDGTGFEVR